MKSPKFARYCKFYYYKIVAARGTPEYIARGWALGVAAGIVIPLGLQLPVSLLLALWLHASKLGATLGTMFCNPLTVWVIYPLQCTLGSWILNGSHRSVDASREALRGVMEHLSWHTFSNLGSQIVWEFLTGGVVLALVFAPPTYFAVLYAVRKFRRRFHAFDPASRKKS